MKKLGWAGVIAGVLLLGGCAAPPTPAQAERETQGDAAFLAELRPRLSPHADLEDAALIGLGRQACAEFAEGVGQVDLRLLDGEQPTATGKYADSSAIGYWAAVSYCPEAWD